MPIQQKLTPPEFPFNHFCRLYTAHITWRLKCAKDFCTKRMSGLELILGLYVKVKRYIGKLAKIFEEK